MIIDNTAPISKVASNVAFQKLFDDIQGNILKAHARSSVRLLFLKFSQDAEGSRAWIKGNIANLVNSFSDQLVASANFKNFRVIEEKPFCSFSLTRKGYKHLKIAAIPADKSFEKGLGKGTIVNDPAPAAWEDEYQNDIDALLILAHTDGDQLSIFETTVRNILQGFARIVAAETGEALPGEKEHFGFADGRSQPRFFIEDIAKEGTLNNWDPFAPLNNALVKDINGKAFIGGITGIDDMPVDDFSGDHSYGSYLVFRKLEQDVTGWNKEVSFVASQLNESPALVGAYAVGRFQDGTPVINHSSSTGATPIENDFDYAADMQGAKCPFHAHIRKTNPRGDTVREFGANLENEKKVRISRRGIPYSDINGKKGLLFMCYQGSIVSQFDFMQNSWADSESFLRGGTGVDDVIGQSNGPANTLLKDWPTTYGGHGRKSLSFDQFVTMKGGEYFFTPSISFLKTI